MNTWLARGIIAVGQRTPFAGRGGYSTDTLAERGMKSDFPQADTESSRADDFHDFFGDSLVKSALQGKQVLDFGSGFGGRTVEYARAGAGFVWGIEPFETMVERSRAYASHRAVDNVGFKVCSQDSIPFPEGSFDVVVSYDVIEHVDDPRRSIMEIHRVLKPGGTVFLVFPVYFGALSHHLDYVSMIPGLHWIFSAHTLVSSVNRILEEQGGDTKPQPSPKRSFDDRRFVLPNLNGLGGEHLADLFKDFDVVRLHRHGLIKRRRPRTRSMKIISALPVRLADMVTSSISCVLTKR